LIDFMINLSNLIKIASVVCVSAGEPEYSQRSAEKFLSQSFFFAEEFADELKTI